MNSTWIVGLILAGALIGGGLVKWKNPMRASTRQMSIIIGFSVLLMILAIWLDDLFHWWSKFPMELLGIAGLLLVVERTIRSLRARRLSGALLLDLGRVPLQDLIINLFAGLALVVLSVMDLIQLTRQPNWSFRSVSLQILCLSLAYAVLLQGLSRRNLNDRGVFFGTGLLPWETIHTFHWERESTTSSMLVLHKKTRLPLFDIMTISVKAGSVQSVEELLRHHAITPVSEPVTTVEEHPA
jgi:hypothetical protein